MIFPVNSIAIILNSAAKLQFFSNILHTKPVFFFCFFLFPLFLCRFLTNVWSFFVAFSRFLAFHRFFRRIKKPLAFLRLRFVLFIRLFYMIRGCRGKKRSDSAQNRAGDFLVPCGIRMQTVFRRFIEIHLRMFIVQRKQAAFPI